MGVAMSSDSDRHTAELLREAAETHDTVYRITDGDDRTGRRGMRAGCSELSELSDVLGVRPVRSHLVHAFVRLDRDYTAAQPTDRWEDCYATRLAGFLVLG